SLSSTTVVVAPPMHTSLWQSPAGALVTSVPLAALLELHWPLPLQENVLQTVSVPQSSGCRHCTQAGVGALPWQNAPPPWLHAKPLLRGGFDGTPLVQRSFVHSLPSTNTSVLSTAVTMPPLPLQTFFLQSPGV